MSSWYTNEQQDYEYVILVHNLLCVVRGFMHYIIDYDLPTIATRLINWHITSGSTMCHITNYFLMMFLVAPLLSHLCCACNSDSSSSLSSTFTKHKNIRHRAYGQRIREAKHASLHLSVFSCRQRAGWLIKPQFSKSVRPLSYRLSLVMKTLWSLVGIGFSLLFSTFEVLTHPMVFSIGLCHQWT